MAVPAWNLVITTDAKYAERARRTITAILNELKNHSAELDLLRLLTFAGLFAPGFRFDKEIFKLFTEFASNRDIHPLLRELIRCEPMQRTTGEELSGSSEWISIPIQKMAHILAEGLFNVPAAIAKYVSDKLLPLLIKCVTLKEQSPSYAPIASIMLSVVHYSFCLFNLWHWLPAPEPRNMRKSATLKFSFLIEIMILHSTLKTTAELFERVAVQCAQLEAPHGRRVRGLITHGCRLVEKYAQKGDYNTRTRQFERACQVLDRIGSHLQQHEDVLLRRATIYKYRMKSLIDVHTRPGDFQEYVSMLYEEFTRSHHYYMQCIDASKATWSFPFIGYVQLHVQLYIYLQQLYPRSKRSIMDSRKNLDFMYQSMRARGDVNAPYVKHFYMACSESTVQSCFDHLTEFNNASNNVKVGNDHDRNVDLFEQLLLNLKRLAGDSITPLERAKLDLLNGIAKLDTSTLCKSLAVISRSLADSYATALPLAADNLAGVKGPAGADSISASNPNQLRGRFAELSNILELATAIAARTRDGAGAAVATGPQKDGSDAVERRVNVRDLWAAECNSATLTILQNPVVQVQEWLTSTNEGIVRSYGLNPYIALLMLALYHKLNPGLLKDGEVPLQLDLTLQRLDKKSSEYYDTSTPRYFIANEPALPNVPFSTFISVYESASLAHVHGRHHEHLQAFAKQGNVKIFSGMVVLVEEKNKNKSSVKSEPSRTLSPKHIQCTELGVTLRFTRYEKNAFNKADESVNFDVDDEVTFAVAIKGHGLWAHGVQLFGLKK